MLKKFVGDLHIHTCLSPCGEREMIPEKIIEVAKSKGLNLIGISDHNSCENVAACLKVGERAGIKVLGGIEITTSEEVHILGCFDEILPLLKIQEIIYENLEGENEKEVFGEQLIVDEDNEIIGENNKLLIGATKIGINEVVNLIQNQGGLAIASHIDRPAFSILGQLGFIPENLKLDAVEVSPNYELRIRNYELQNLPIVSFSDAHRLEEIGSAKTTFILKEPTVKELKKALLNQDGRGVIV